MNEHVISWIWIDMLGDGTRGLEKRGLESSPWIL